MISTISIGRSAVRLDLYQEETAQIAHRQAEMLDEAKRKRDSGEGLARLE